MPGTHACLFEHAGGGRRRLAVFWTLLVGCLAPAAARANTGYYYPNGNEVCNWSACTPSLSGYLQDFYFQQGGIVQWGEQTDRGLNR